MTESDLPVGEEQENRPSVQRLVKGQNYFDQPPFNDILTRVSRSYDGSVVGYPYIEGIRSDLAYLLSMYAEEIEKVASKDGKREREITFMHSLVNHLPQVPREIRGKYADVEYSRELQKAMVGVIDFLGPLHGGVGPNFKPVSEWRTYVRTREDAMYSPNGDYKNTRENRGLTAESMPLTYDSWLQQRRQTAIAVGRGRQAQDIQDVVAEAFPQGSTAEAVQQFGSPGAAKHSRRRTQPPR